jgi:hypothetical protein
VTTPKKILVTGSRDWTNWAAIERELRRFPAGTILVHGAARGADSIADEIGYRLGFVIRSYPVPDEEWTRLGPKAGPMRNSKMLREEHPDHDGIMISEGLAFTLDLERSRGTRDMVGKLRGANIPVGVFAS